MIHVYSYDTIYFIICGKTSKYSYVEITNYIRNVTLQHVTKENQNLSTNINKIHLVSDFSKSRDLRHDQNMECVRNPTSILTLSSQRLKDVLHPTSRTELHLPGAC